MGKRAALLFFILIFLFYAVFFKKCNIETGLISALMPQYSEKAAAVIQAADKSSAVIKIFFEGGAAQKDEFLNKIDKTAFELNEIDISKYIELYKKSPSLFLSDKDRELIKNKEYETLFQNALNSLFNPVSANPADFTADPFFLLQNFLLSNKIEQKNQSNTAVLKIKDDAAASKIINKKISELINLSKNMSSSSSEIFLSGTPVHSYSASKNASIAVNVISILSSLFICCVSFFYFRNLKIIIPVLCSTAFGILAGFSAVKFFFPQFHILAAVFASSIIGLSIDYSYHYFFGRRSCGFAKNLACSLITTIISFSFLYFTDIELLKQTAVFCIAALSAVFFFVIAFYPLFEQKFIKDFSVKLRDEKFLKRVQHDIKNCGIKKSIPAIVCIASVFGLFNLHFNDFPSAFYKPDKKLIKAENLFSRASGIKGSIQLAALSGGSLEEILEKEEQAAEYLKHKNIDYIALSKFFPSIKRQKENIKLVKDLYENYLDKFSWILSENQIKKLRQTELEAVPAPDTKEFMLNEKTSLMMINTAEKLDINLNGVQIINIQNDTAEYLKDCRIKLLKILPFMLAAAAAAITAAFGLKRGVKILMPPLLSAPAALFAAQSIQGELNFFSLVSAVLVLGFTIDYAVFKSEGGADIAVKASALTTAFSFLLLSFAPFKLISSIALVLFFGIISAYSLCCIIFEKGTK